MLKNNLIIIGFICLVSGCSVNHKISESTINIDQQYWGTWQSSGYGYAINLSADGMEVYDISQSYCKKHETSLNDTQTYFTNLNYYDINNIGISRLEESKVYKFKRIPKLPNFCLIKISDNPQETFKYFVELMSEHYAFFKLYGVNWDARVSKVSQKVHENISNTQLLEVFDSLLKGINDGHLFIQASINGKIKTVNNDASRVLTPALDTAFRKQSKIKDRDTFGALWYRKTIGNIIEHLLPDANISANDQIIWGQVGNIGYINILNMHGFSNSGSLQDELNAFDKAFEKIMSNLASSSSIIIDVTINSGGADEIGRMITNYFTQDKTLLYSHLPLGSSNEPQKHYTNPTGKQIYRKPIYLYTSDHTVSAAETFTMAMKALPTVIHIGTTTRGAFSDILDKTLPNGWEVGLSNMYYWDAHGKNWESIGLKPDINIPVFSGNDIYNSHLEATKKLLQQIAADHP